jgi:hypothetical protein
MQSGEPAMPKLEQQMQGSALLTGEQIRLEAQRPAHDGAYYAACRAVTKVQKELRYLWLEHRRRLTNVSGTINDVPF